MILIRTKYVISLPAVILGKDFYFTLDYQNND